MNPLSKGIPVDKPLHDPAPLRRVQSRVVATWPVGTFVENIVVAPEGDLLVAIHSLDRIERVTAEGAKSVFAELPGPPSGLAYVDRELFVCVSPPGQPPGDIYRIDHAGSPTKWLSVPDALFLNGATPFLGQTFLAGDAIGGRIYRIDVAARTATVWLADQAFAKVTAQPWMPGINGLKTFGGHVYFSNTDASFVGRIPFDRDGKPGAVERIAERLTCDDFAFDVSGALYATTHIQNSLLRVSPDGARAVLADASDGMAGATAIAFGAGPGDRHAAYVTTTGGILAPMDGTVQEAKLVRLDVGAEGASLAPEGGRQPS